MDTLAQELRLEYLFRFLIARLYSKRVEDRADFPASQGAHCDYPASEREDSCFGSRRVLNS